MRGCPGNAPRRKPYRGAPQPLRYMVLEKLREGPQTTDDLLVAFPDFSIITMRTVIPQLRAMGYNVASCPFKRNRSFTVSYRYTLLPPKPRIVIR